MATTIVSEAQSGKSSALPEAFFELERVTTCLSAAQEIELLMRVIKDWLRLDTQPEVRRGTRAILERIELLLFALQDGLGDDEVATEEITKIVMLEGGAA